ncbi:[protein-PII] uridylyltransferase [Vulgatibacter incomptus]|uniref:Bifunctional uridylyltransferase/uridylyl-removing enzyme n=1 Tax=Vulgatibacter incomptus TaxID=1391653 RepID=A0A0K1PAL2_9BACT|nr:[protein-PII] uridylyltransferase [Vulgatibacter incomptus]AKU90578.1 [Protein-PII] uridylyltransferase [Vulgatibacter incomptus]
MTPSLSIGLPDLADPASRAEAFRAYVEAMRGELRERHEAGAKGREIVRATSRLLSKAIAGLFEELHREAGSPEGMALAAVGGFGRMELAPYSDVDLLLVHDGLPEPVVQQVAEPLFRILWDARLEVGASVRTPDECVEAAAADHTVRTALLDCRRLAGDPGTYARFEGRVLRDLPPGQVDALVVAKTAELRRRRERFGGSVHLLEPNVKQSPGALRDLQAALWMARARFKAGGLSDLLSLGVMPQLEVERLKEARDFLWRVRNQLHYLAGRKEDHLTFHWQEQVATALGYRTKEPEGLAVEQFMRDYYLAASAIRRLADELAERCAPASAAPAAPTEWMAGPGLKVWKGKLTFDDPDALARDPSLFVRLFTTSEKLGVDIYGFARDRIRDEAARIDDAIRTDPAVCKALKEALAKLGTGEWLRQMHREGVLGALVPEFGRVTAKHQHDLYHVYTVDVHTVFAMQKLARLRAGELLDEEPELSLAAREIQRPLALSLGVLFHDAGKGMGGSHSEKGAELVRRFCARVGVSPAEADDAEFLVREHLAMSHVSQRRDLSDPELIADFAGRMGGRDRLDMLYVLTFVDTFSVGPGTWTSWKGRLLTELHQKTAAALQGKAVDAGRASAQREALLARDIDAARADAFLARMPRRYFAFADPADALRSMRVLELAAHRGLATAVRDTDQHTTVTLAAADRPGLLASIAGVFTAHRLDILSADVFSTSDGKALDVFVVRGPGGGKVERSRWRRARRDLVRVLGGELSGDDLVRKALEPSGLPPRHVPAVPTKVKVDDRSSRRFTVVDVFAADRRGLLHALTSALRTASLTIAVARIATEGNRAIDSFYVCDAEGRKLQGGVRIAELETLLRSAADAGR